LACSRASEGGDLQSLARRCDEVGPISEETPSFPKPGGPYKTFLEGECGRVNGALGTHCWNYENYGFCADAPGPASPTHRLVVGQRERLKLFWETKAVPKQVDVEVLTWPDRTALEREARAAGREAVGVGHTERVTEVEVEKDNPTTLALVVDPGRYLIQVGSRWEQGDMSHTFAVTVLKE
jgi:hypothetical protein